MNLFTSQLDAERLARAAEPAARAADLDAVVTALHTEGVPLALGARRVAYAGSETPRERVWLQLDACAGEAVGAMVGWAALESLTTERPAQYRIPVVGRARIAVVIDEQSVASAAPNVVPLLDAGWLGTQTPMVEALRRFAPSFVVHVQDWTGEVRGPLAARLVESFHLDAETHAALPARGGGRRLSRARRAYRAAAANPDWMVGTRTLAYVRRLGVPLRELLPEREGDQLDRHAVHAIAPARHIPTLPYRRLGAGNLGELALATCGAHAITLQLRGGSPLERAALALAVAEAAIVQRMGLVQQESGE